MKQDRKLFYDYLMRGDVDWYPLFHLDGGEDSKRREGLRINEAVRFEITNVYEYMQANADQFAMGCDVTSRIIAAPTFPVMWFEYRCEAASWGDLVGVGSDRPNPITVGILTTHVDLDYYDSVHNTTRSLLKNSPQFSEHVTADTKWFVMTTSWQRERDPRKRVKKGTDLVMGPGYDVALLVNKHGVVTYCAVSPHYNRDAWPTPNLKPLSESDQADGVTKVVPALFALTFMNCRNVETVTLEPSAKLSKKHKKKHGQPLTRYSMLRIDVTKTETSVQTKKDDPGAISADMPFHICRGHFRIYSKEKPLFGHYVGPIWVPAHVRGNRIAGTTVHDYTLEGLPTRGDA